MNRLRGQSAFLIIVCGLILFISMWFIVVYSQSSWMIERHVKSEKWSLPSTIYAAPLILFPGMPIRQSDLIDYLDKIEYFRVPARAVSAGNFAVLDDGIILQKRPFLSAEEKHPNVLVELSGGEIQRLVNLHTDKELDRFPMEPIAIKNLFGEEWEKRTLVSFEDFPSHLIEAVLAIEDRRFFRHSGVDTFGILRAGIKNLSGERLEGGSTITQQLAKNFFLSPERSIKRKIHEAILAVLIEKRQSKETILEAYLNQIYMGQRGAMSIHGMGEASRLFFHKEVGRITIPEAALLAGMIRGQNAYNPVRNPEAAKERRNVVLKAMQEEGFITKAQYASFSKTPLRVFSFESKVNLAPYFGDVVKTQLLQKYDSETVYKRNLHVFTSLDLDMQEIAERVLKEGLESIDRRRLKSQGKKVQGCLIAIEPQTGYIRAFVGGRNYSKSQFNRINQASRQPGSVFKPVVYAAALQRAFERKPAFTPATLVEDGPWVLKYGDQTWEPKNYDGEYHGIVTLRTALAHSMNIATARLAAAVGLEEIADLSAKLGFENVKPYPAIALGAFEVSPWHVARAYSVFANGGMRAELQTVTQVIDTNGKILERTNTQQERVLHPQTAFLVTDMLRSVVTEGTAASLRKYGFFRPAAGKTGTTNEFRDAWFVGYTPELMCVVWIGYDDNTPLKLNGAEAALPIWANFMKQATARTPVRDFPAPEGIEARIIDPTTGKLAGQNCPVAVTEIFISGTQPNAHCDSHAYSYYAYNDFNRRSISSEERDRPRFKKKKKWWKTFKFW